MFLTNELIKQLAAIYGTTADKIDESKKIKYGGSSFSIILSKDGNTLTLKMESNVDDDFKEWCDKVDQDIFLQACELCEEWTGKSIKEIADTKQYEIFKNLIKNLTRDKIRKLSNIFLDD